MFSVFINSLLDTIKKTFVFRGRATKLDYWTFVVCAIIVNTILSLILYGGFAIHEVVGFILLGFIGLIYIAEFICGLTLQVRRLHDLGLSGFWLFYLNPVGLPVVFMVYLLNIDNSCNRIIDKIHNVGSTWLGWILTFLFWPIGSVVALIVLYLYDGKDEANEYGPSPYAAAPAAPLA